MLGMVATDTGAGEGALPQASAAEQERRATTRVLLVSPHRLTRETVRFALRRGGFAAASLGPLSAPSDVYAARRWIATMRPDVGLLVAELDDAAQLRAAVAVITELDTEWLVLTASPVGPAWGAMLDAGARDVLPMTTGSLELFDALRLARAGEPRPSRPARTRIVRAWRNASAEHKRMMRRIQSLSAREMEILVELHTGIATREIAAKVGVSEGTVRSQIKSMLRKLGVSSQLQAVAAFQRLNDWLGGRADT